MSAILEVLDRTSDLESTNFSDLWEDAEGARLPCTDHDPEVFFPQLPEQVEPARAICRECPMRAECLDGAIRRREPHGVWGGELFLDGAVIARKRPRGRPRKDSYEQAA